MSLGPIEIEVIRNALTAAAAEMDITIWRTSRSTTLYHCRRIWPPTLS